MAKKPGKVIEEQIARIVTHFGLLSYRAAGAEPGERHKMLGQTFLIGVVITKLIRGVDFNDRDRETYALYNNSWASDMIGMLGVDGYLSRPRA